MRLADLSHDGNDAQKLAVPAGAWEQALAAVLDGSARVDVRAQPIVDIERRSVLGYEALARFEGPPEAAPHHWFREASKRGLAASLEALTLTNLLAMRPELSMDMLLAINIDPLRLADEAVKEAVLTMPSLDGLLFELTRPVPAGGPAFALASYRAAGVAIAVDCTTGRTGLTDLLGLRPEVVKVDRRLIGGIDQDPQKQEAVASVVDLADRVEAWVIAEGVERHEEQVTLTRLGVHHAQGFLYGVPQEPWAEVPESVFG